MRNVRLFGLIGFALLGLLISSLLRLAAPSLPSSAQSIPSPAHSPLYSSPSETAPVADVTVEYDTYEMPRTVIHVLTVPQQGFAVVPVVAPEVEFLPDFAESSGAIAGVNGGFFDPVNQKTTSYIVLDSVVVADPAQNERLVNNPDMIPYLDRIFNRSEFRQYQCDDTTRYDIAAHNEPVPQGCQLLNSLGAGPRLLPELAAVEEGFAEIVDGELVRDALGSTQPNARTAVGITPRGEVVLAMAAQRPDAPSQSGVSLSELAEFMGTLGVDEALNLDGGSSSSLYYQGRTYYGRVDTEGSPIERPVKSVLLVQAR